MIDDTNEAYFVKSLTELVDKCGSLFTGSGSKLLKINNGDSSCGHIRDFVELNFNNLGIRENNIEIYSYSLLCVHIS